MIKEGLKLSGIKGMTIAELMISLGIFSLIVTTSTAIFIQIIKTSRMVTTRSTAIDTLSLVIEQIAREVRTGRYFKDNDPLDQSLKSKLVFTNYLSEVVTYEFKSDGRLYKNDTAITPLNLKIEGKFIVTDFSNKGAGNKTTPRVLVSAVAKDSRGIVLSKAQTTVGARLIYYKK